MANSDNPCNMWINLGNHLQQHDHEQYDIKITHIYGLTCALTSKQRSPGFKSQLVTVGGPVTIIIWSAQPDRKLALS